MEFLMDMILKIKFILMYGIGGIGYINKFNLMDIIFNVKLYGLY